MHKIIPFIEAPELQTIVQGLGQDISRDYADTKPLLIGILNGCKPFLRDLTNNLTIPVETTYMKVRSYEGTESSGDIQLDQDVDTSVEGRDIIIVEDIIDTGMTMTYLCELLKARNPKSLKVVTLLDKPSRRKVEFVADYVGKEILNVFVVGYGMDYNGGYRDLGDDYIGELILNP